MSKYIEVDALKEQIRKSHGIRSLDYLLPIEKEIVKEVDSAPTIDAISARWAYEAFEPFKDSLNNTEEREAYAQTLELVREVYHEID